MFQRMADLERKGETFAIATIVQARGSVPRHEMTKMLILRDGTIEGTIGGGQFEGQVIEEALLAMRDGKPRILQYAFRDPEQGDVGVCGGEVEVLVEPVLARPTLIVVGAGHVGKAIVRFAEGLDFRVVVSDDRAEFASAENAPGAHEYILCSLGDLPERVAITDQTYLVLTTRGVPVDVEGLPALLDSPAAYIGVIGSRRRWEKSVEELLERGVPQAQLARVTSPMGIELNAETPEEIAISILAEIIMLRRGGTGERMAHKPASESKARGASQA